MQRLTPSRFTLCKVFAQPFRLHGIVRIVSNTRKIWVVRLGGDLDRLRSRVRLSEMLCHRFNLGMSRFL